MKDAVSTYHPSLAFLYFSVVILSAMVFLHPIFLAISFLGALTYSLWLNGRKGVRFLFFYLLPMMIIAGLVNPLFNHRGMTILWYWNDNPITLESIFYGIAIGVMFGTVILWFSCFHQVMTADKIIFLFGRLFPSLSLIFAMVFRFVPKFKAQIHVISKGQKSIGHDVSNGQFIDRIRNGIQILSIMVSWSLENAIETADSMKARGYGLPGRTSYSIYRFDARDKRALTFGLLLVGVILYGSFSGETAMQYFPMILSKNISWGSSLYQGTYLLLCFGPLILNSLEALKWRRFQSRI